MIFVELDVKTTFSKMGKIKLRVDATFPRKKCEIKCNLTLSQPKETLKKERDFWRVFITYVKKHCVKSVQIQSYFWSVFSCIRTEYRDSLYSGQIQENTDQKKSVFRHFSSSERVRRQMTEVVTWSCFVKKMLLRISQNSRVNTCAGVSF